MTPYERVFNRLSGKPVDRIPNLNIVMTFAARYIHVNYSRYVKDYHYLVDGNIDVCGQFGIDLLSAISDPYRETSGFGANIIFPEDGVPQCTDFLIKTYTDIKKLSVHNPLKSERMLDRINAVEQYKSKVLRHYPVLGWVEGAFAEANDLRGMTELMMDLVEAPDFVKELLEICIAQSIAFAREQIKAGADFIGIGDAAASLVGPSIYRDMILPTEIKLIEEIHAAGAKAKLHICGNTSKILEYMKLSGADIIDVDWMVDFGRAVGILGSSCTCGNFDPVAVLLRGNPEHVKSAVGSCIRHAKDNTFIAAGCEVPRDTPYANMMAVKEALTEWATSKPGNP